MGKQTLSKTLGNTVGLSPHYGGASELFQLITRRAELQAKLALMDARKDAERWRTLWAQAEADGRRAAELRPRLDEGERERLGRMLAAEVQALDGPTTATVH